MNKWMDTDLPFKKRAEILVNEMTLEEKISQMVYNSSEIKRLGIQKYNWWNECLHGVARAGYATVFPQAIGMAATFNTEIVNKAADIISTEARAKHHHAKIAGDFTRYKGLTMWAPNVNIFRDPRWGRGQETYGEDPYLTSRMGVSFCKGLQGDDEKYLKTIATPKHFAIHSGPESMRHEMDVKIEKKLMNETYLPAFEACVKEAKAASVMGAYNRVNAQPCCASKELLKDILVDEWGFDGYVVSDCGAIEDFHKYHKVTDTPEQSAAMAVNNGCQLNCGKTYESLKKAVEQGLITENTINDAVYKLMYARMNLGMFDPDDIVPYANIPYEKNDCTEHHELNKLLTAESIVLLKNDKLLPLNRDVIKKIAVIGPNADNKLTLLGNYSGEPSVYSTLLDGIKKVHGDAEIIYAQGCTLAGGTADENALLSEALWAAEQADVVILAMGLNAAYEGEEDTGDTNDAGGDKSGISLPYVQGKLLDTLKSADKPMVYLNFTGSCVDLTKADELCEAVLQCWYPGQFGGEVIAGMIFGDYQPSGKLPVTFYKNNEDIPTFDDYSMEQRTYRYFQGEPLYPFGYGLNYSHIEYYRIYLSQAKIKAGEDITVTVFLKNKGKYNTKDVVQAYLVDEYASTSVPLRRLAAFKKVHLAVNEEVKTSLVIKSEQMAIVDDNGSKVIEPGRFSLYVGAGQPDDVTAKLYNRDCLHIGFLVE